MEPECGAHVREITEEIERVGEALSNPVRACIVARLMCGLAKFGDIRVFLCRVYSRFVNPNVVAFHLRRLIENGIVERRFAGPNYIYSLSDTRAARAAQLLLRSYGLDTEEWCRAVLRAGGSGVVAVSGCVTEQQEDTEG